jgi:hypothetical protein
MIEEGLSVVKYLETCLWVFNLGNEIVDTPEKATECLQLSLLSTSYFFFQFFPWALLHVAFLPQFLEHVNELHSSAGHSV